MLNKLLRQEWVNGGGLMKLRVAGLSENEISSAEPLSVDSGGDGKRRFSAKILVSSGYQAGQKCLHWVKDVPGETCAHLATSARR